MRIRICWLLVLFLYTVPLTAQEPISTNELVLGSLVDGRIDNSSPRVVYLLNGSRGEVIRLNITTTDGNLDPILTILDDDGDLVLSRDDYQSSQDIEATLSFTENGRYFVIVARFGYTFGSTSGTYELGTELVGVLSTQGSTLQYGIPVTNTITNTQPQVYYTFQANEGDIINIQMVRSSGRLDPLLQVVDGNRFLIAENDDADGFTKNARIENLVIQQTGTYIVVATRYGEAIGESVGSFALVIDQGQNSGLGNNRQAPATILMNQTLSGEITDEQYQRFYRFTGVRDQLVTITMDRASFPGQLDSYLILANAGFQPLADNDDGGAGSNARIERFRIPANGTYHIVATRFDRAEGTSTGEYTLSLIEEGSAFDGVATDIPRLLYGTMVPDAISEEDPESLYVFWGVAGEVVTISMDKNSGDLDPVLELLDADQVRMLRDDDSGANKNARIERHTLPYTGVYYIRATRYEGSSGPSNTTGTFNLNLVRINEN